MSCGDPADNYSSSNYNGTINNDPANNYSDTGCKAKDNAASRDDYTISHSY